MPQRDRQGRHIGSSCIIAMHGRVSAWSGLHVLGWCRSAKCAYADENAWSELARPGASLLRCICLTLG